MNAAVCESQTAAFYCTLCRRGGACPSRLVSEFLRSTPGGSSCGSARRAVALYECHGPRRTGGSGDPPLRRTTGISETWREGQAPHLRGGGKTFRGGELAGGHMGPPLRHLRWDTAERGGAPKKPTKTTATFPGTLQQYFTKTRLCNNYDAILRFCYTSPKPVDGGPALEYSMSTGKGSYALTGWIFSDGSGLILAFRK